jgi:hypothetical protein
MKEEHLDVYKNRSVLYSNDASTTFLEGRQSEDAKKRYEIIVKAFDAGFYAKAMENIPAVLMQDTLSEAHKNLMKSLVDGLTSEVGRALVGLSCLQLAIKSISPEQSVRLHKGGQRQSGFSWQEGISMRTLDNRYNTPFLREYGLLNINKDGIMMTRSLAENYPYSRLYKAELRGPVVHWISIVEALEDNLLPPYPSLCYLLSMLKNRSDAFTKKADAMIESVRQIKNLTPEKVQNALIMFFTATSYSARAFEVVIHCFIQALYELKLADGVLVPLSQMRSANKKHGNVGDVELKQGNMIIESWDAKYGKPYLRDELEELHDKLHHHPNVEIAGFITNSDVNRATDIESRAEELSIIHNCEIMLLSFNEWLEMKFYEISNDNLLLVAKHWLIAVVESFGQKRPNLAPIDEPCDQWLDDLSKALGSL